MTFKRKQGSEPIDVEPVNNEFQYTDDDLVRDRLRRWRLPVHDTTVTVAFVWKHGIGWTSMRMGAGSFQRSIKISPGFYRRPG